MRPLPWRTSSLVQQEEEVEPAHQDYDPTKFLLVDKEVIHKIDTMKSECEGFRFSSEFVFTF